MAAAICNLANFGSNAMAAFEEFIESAWADHAEQAQAVAARLAASTAIVVDAAQVAPFAGLVVHVFGEHLGQWQRGDELLQGLAATAAGDPAAQALLSRQRAALQAAAGDDAALSALPPSDAAAAWAIVSSIFSGRADFDGSALALRRALSLAEGGLPAQSPANRALAVAGNNLAAALEELGSARSAVQTLAMVHAAEVGLKYWQLAGGWLEAERAEYRLARSLLQAGRATDAAQAAQRCLAMCEQHDAPAFERVFGFAALSMALRAASDTSGADAARADAQAQFSSVPADEQHWCAADLREIGVGIDDGGAAGMG
jgi:hypothetical protein